VHDIASKQNLRRDLLAARRRMDPAQRTAASRALRDTLLAQPELEMAASVAAYASFGDEPDTRGLLFALWKRGTYVLLPLLMPDGDLDWASFEGPESLEPGPFGLLQPTEPRRGVDAIKAADVIVAPALAVDRTGMRLGRGGGSFDRALARVGEGILTVGVVYDGELVEELPAEPHDQRVRAVATPSGGLSRLR
jgi:5-formyltetrahydrofolate cyclo-ligase